MTDLTHLSPDEALQVIRRRMSERELQERVEALLTANLWHYIHIRDARGQNVTGWPDLVAFRTQDRRRLAIELKSSRGRLTPAQAVWLRTLEGCDFETLVVTPAELTTLEEFLR